MRQFTPCMSEHYGHWTFLSYRHSCQTNFVISSPFPAQRVLLAMSLWYLRSTVLCHIPTTYTLARRLLFVRSNIDEAILLSQCIS